MAVEHYSARTILNGGGIFLLDGASGTELEKSGVKMHPKLWGAGSMLPGNEQAVASLYKSYFQAGANIVTTPSYQASWTGFKGIVDQETYFRLLEKCVRDARDAAAKATSPQVRLVAASVGPYGASLCDGSEFTGNYGNVTEEELIEFHTDRMKAYLKGEPDILLIETIPNRLEVLALGKVVEALDVKPPVWLSFSIKSDGKTAPTLADGTTFADLAKEISPRFEAIGMNCCDPESAKLGLQALKVFNRPLMFYPNSGEVYDAQKKVWEGVPGTNWDREAWFEEGVQVIGGCCRVGPDTIASLRQFLDAKRTARATESTKPTTDAAGVTIDFSNSLH